MIGMNLTEAKSSIFAMWKYGRVFYMGLKQKINGTIGGISPIYHENKLGSCAWVPPTFFLMVLLS